MSSARRPFPLMEFQVVNVVASTRLSRSVDLRRVSAVIPEAYFDHEHFPGIIYRRKQPKSTIILFANGKFVSTGTTSEKESKMSLRISLEEVVQAEGVPAHLGPIVTVNIVATCNLGRHLDLRKIHALFPQSSYEPERFPGLIVRHPDHCASLLFSSGRVVSTGARSEKSAHSIIATIQGTLRKL